MGDGGRNAYRTLWHTDPYEEGDTFEPKDNTGSAAAAAKAAPARQDATAELQGADGRRENLAPATHAEAQRDVKFVEQQVRSSSERERAARDTVHAQTQAASVEQQAEHDDPSRRTADGGSKPNPPPRFSKRGRAVFSWLWDQNFSPFQILRSSLFFGPLLTGRYTTRRFGALPAEDLKSLHAYSHAIFTSKGSSEYCLSYILAPGAYARWPMTHRIHPVRDVPVSFIYGKHDWMDVESGREACRVLKEAGNTRTSCFVVPNAGHHVYLDNPKAHDALILRLLRGEADGIVR